jgi:hypothetical protein
MSELVLEPARHGPFPGHLAPEVIAAYAAATGDQTAAVLEGLAVPVVFPVILVFTAQEAARADVPAAAWQRVRGGVHGEHDIVLHQALVPGQRLDTSSWISAVRTSRAGTQIVVQVEQVGVDGAVAVEQLDLLGVDDPARVRRLAVRFASPTPLDSELTVNAFGITDHSFAFEAASNGATTITHGRLELRS